MPWTTCSAWRAMNVCGPGSKARCKRRRGYMRRPGSRRGCLPSFSIRRRRTRVGAGAAGWWPRPSRLRAKRTRASSSPQSWAAAALYEQLYCARGDMENRIKEQFSLFSDRLSTATRSEEHTSELQSHHDLVCRLLLEKKKKNNYYKHRHYEQLIIY